MVMQHSDWGWNQADCQPLINMWTLESSWSWSALNRQMADGTPENAPYGIPQSYPGSKMASFGADWKDNAGTQIDWGLSYIHSAYGSPRGAWSFWQTHHAY